jgi:PAS domain S-box-containing protein
MPASNPSEAAEPLAPTPAGQALHFYKAFHASADPVAIADFPSGRMTEVNDAYLRLFGYTREEAIGRSGGELGLWADEGDRKRFIETLDHKGAVEEMEVVKRKRGGQRVICRIAANRVDLGDRVAIVTRIRDITEQRMAEAALRESEERFLKAFRAMPDAILITTLEEGRIIDVNGSFTRIFGWSQEESVGRTTLQLGFWITSGDRTRIVGRLRDGKPAHGERIAVRDKSGETHQCVYFGEKTEIAGQPYAISIIRDVTDQQRLEEQLRQAQKMESIGLLAGGVAHDFNNVLTVIQGNVSLVLDDPRLPGDLTEMLRQVLQASEFAAGLTRQLLVFGRRQVLQPDRLAPAQVVHRVAGLLRRTLGDHIVLRTDIPPKLPEALADSGMVEQVLINLAINARDAMPKGGELLIAAEARETGPEYLRQVPQAKVGRFIGLRVRDTGIGIPAGNLPRIFDPFFSTKTEGRGTGLGLATVYSIAQQHGGWIEVDSQVGRGTEFSVWLPVAAGPPTPAPAAAPMPAAASGGRETLLVVEDREEVRVMVRNVFDRQGYRTLLAESGPTALDLWARHRDEIALLFTDIVMPGGVNGRELADRLRSERPELKVIYCSGFDANVLGPDALTRPGTHFLAKPFNIAQMARLVRDMLDER